MPIDFHQWLTEFRENWRESPASATLQAGYYAYLGAWLTLTSHPRFQLGTNVYDRADEWDLLVVLDACRVDALRAVAPEYDFLPRPAAIGSMWSLGSASAEWLCKTFTTDHRAKIARTACLSANPYVTKTFDDRIYAPPKAAPFGKLGRDPVDIEDFALLHPIYESHTSDRYDVVLPEAVTNATIAAGRDPDVDADRYIAHYMQPHKPYYAAALAADRDLTPAEGDPWSQLRCDAITTAEVRRSYLDTLRHALDSVGVLCSNIDAERVAITADHGEMLGTWRIGSHPTGCPHPEVKRVPWASTTATDEGTCEVPPLASRTEPPAERSVDEQLEALGYR